MKSRKSFLLRINPVLHEALEAWARDEFRSVNGQLEFLLKEAVQRNGRWPPPDAKERGDDDAEAK